MMEEYRERGRERGRREKKIERGRGREEAWITDRKGGAEK